MHRTIEPAIQYWGTPVVLVSTLNDDGTANVAPMSSAWWLGWSCMLGLDLSSCTTHNLRARRECVLNLAGPGNAPAVDALARTTGSAEVPLHKQVLGYRHVSDKARHAGLTLDASEAVSPPRVRECPVQLEARVVEIHPFGASDPRMAVPACAVEVQIERVHAHPELVVDQDRIDADAWQPLLMSFRRLFARGRPVSGSRLCHGDEALYAPWKPGWNPATMLPADCDGGARDEHV